MTRKTASDVAAMEKVGRLAAETLKYAGSFIKAGMTTEEIDKIVHEYTLSKGAKPAPLGYHGFPKASCTSVNEVVCHGVPDSTVLKDGDIVNLDVTCILNGFHGDTSRTFFVGDVSDAAKNITDAAFEAMNKGIEQVKAGNTTGDIGFAINKYVTRRGYHIVRDIGGHGIGKKFHEEPFVPSYGKKGKGAKLIKWGCLTVEPMINETDARIIEHDIKDSSIKWYTTEDSCLSAQFEHTVLITDEGYQILTVCD
ncbi:MAG: type I methionyl aminopeptidase [Bdellovibrionota bacterium]